MIADALGLPHGLVYAYLATLREQRARERSPTSVPRQAS
jgi:hypothetical protein